jgi:hypothetical protein
MSAAAPNLSPSYQVGSTTLSTPGHIVLTGASPSPSGAPALTPAQIAQIQAEGIQQAIDAIKGIPILGLFAPAAGQLGTSGDFNPIDAATGAVGAGVGVAGQAAGFTAGIVAQGIGQAAIAGLTLAGHGIANALVTFLQWLGKISKTYVVALAVAGVVLYMVFQ